jgi:DNA invertase Pin-like site-specific DNA recombinase
MVYGYARCSTNEDKQDLNRQIRELKSAGAKECFVEYEHGDSIVKEQLSLLLEQASEGDEIITLEVSRLARSTKQLCDIIEIVKNKKLKLNILGSITVDCTSGDVDPMTNT